MYRSLAVKTVVIVGLTLPFAAFGQTTSSAPNGGVYVAPIAIPGPPVLTPPNASLPGSGPATGAPPSMDVNNAANGGTGSVYQPSPGSLIGSELPGTPAPTVVTGTAAPASATGASSTLNVGMGSFLESSPTTSELSLGDIARRYKSQRAAAHPRQYDNSNIRHADYGTAEANSAALPQSDQPVATYGSTSAPAPQGVLDQHDYAAVQAALARSQSQVNANASDDKVAAAIPDPNRVPAASEVQSAGTDTQTQATEPQVQPQARAERDPARAAKQLPASASPLPLLLVLGLIAIAVGGLFYRMRRSEVSSRY